MRALQQPLFVVFCDTEAARLYWSAVDLSKPTEDPREAWAAPWSEAFGRYVQAAMAAMASGTAYPVGIARQSREIENRDTARDSDFRYGEG